MKRLTFLFTLMMLLALSSAASLAQQCPSGYDQFQTASGTTFNLGGNIGAVSFQGVAIQGSTGNSDTIIQRTQSTTSGQCNLSVYALFLKSTSPINFNGQSADVYVTINNTGGAVPTSTLPQPDTLQASSGTITITSSNSSGGTFESSLSVNANLIFVKAGTSVTDSTNYLGHQAANTESMSAKGVSYSTTAPSGYPSGLSSGGFYVPGGVSGSSHSHGVVVAKCPSSTGTGPAVHQSGTGSNQVPFQKACIATTL